MRWVPALLLMMAACTQAATPPHAPANGKPQRIVSLDICADQYVLKFAAPDQIVALSPDATMAFSYMRESAKGLPRVRADAENILALQPDLVVRAYGGGPNAEHFLKEADIPVLNVGWASDVEGIISVVGDMADGLGAHEEGRALVADLRERLDHINAQPSGSNAMYMTVSGVTTGPGTLIDDMFARAGFTNFETETGWRNIDLEQLTYNQPDRVALAYHETLAGNRDTWSATRHPVARHLLADKPVIKLDGAMMSCSGWYIIDAIEALAQGGPG